MNEPFEVITENIDIWSSAIRGKSAAGRGTSKKIELYGIKKLRELILELAVRGLLVPQDPNDEPANLLFGRVRKDRERFVTSKDIGRTKSVPMNVKVVGPFLIPNSWIWTTISEIGHDWGQKTPDQEFTYIDVASINKEFGLITSPTVLSEKKAPSRARKIVKRGTVIYSTVRPYLLNISIVNQDFTPEPIASTAFAIVHPYEGISASFIFRYLRSPSFIRYVENCQTGIAYPAINDKQFFTAPFPVPPEAEQHRIVTKVDELMALCDQLEQQQESSINAHETLVENLLTALTNAGEKGAFDSAWSRISENFDLLFTTEDSIDQLKATILQLAVMGKLVPQDPNDEPASELLKKIQAEKVRLGQEGRTKTQGLTEPMSSEKPFDLPEGWQWTRLGNAGICSTGKTPSTKIEQYFEGLIPFIGPGEITLSGDLLPSNKKISEEGLQFSEEAIEGDVLMVCIGGSIGKSIICNKRIAFNQQINAIRPLFINSKFLKSAISANYFLESVLENATGSATPIINRSRWERLLVPIAPLEEQHRIVTKLDELMTLCDRLKSKISSIKTTAIHLADSISTKIIQ